MPKPEAIELNCTFTSHRLKADKSVSLTFASALEADEDLMASLFNFHQQEVTLLIANDRKANALSYKGEKNEEGETPSQELRQVIWQKWQRAAEEGHIEPFPSYYNRQMRKIIESAIKNLPAVPK